jgi:hypothetical protein
MFTWGVVGPHRHTMDVGGAMISCVGLPALQLTPSASRASLEFWLLRLSACGSRKAQPL